MVLLNIVKKGPLQQSENNKYHEQTHKRISESINYFDTNFYRIDYNSSDERRNDHF